MGSIRNWFFLSFLLCGADAVERQVFVQVFPLILCTFFLLFFVCEYLPFQALHKWIDAGAVQCFIYFAF